MKKSKKVTPLAFGFYCVPVFLLAAAGLADSIYLSISHYRVYTDIGYRSFCAISKSINCDTVSQSPYSIFLGVPVSVWGVLGYVFFLLLLTMAAAENAAKKRLWRLLFFIALFFSCYSVILAMISAYIIRSHCIMCIVNHFVNLFLLLYTWLVCRRFRAESVLQGVKRDIIYLLGKKRQVVLLFSLFFICMAAVLLFIPEYWSFEPPPLASDIATGVTREEHPWIGAEEPVLVITEFTDYQCFQCKKMHFFLRRLVEENKKKVRLVHRHFPMDSKFNSVIVKEPFYEGSGKLALMAIYAGVKGKFWQMNDVLFNIVRNTDVVDIRQVAEKVGLDADELAAALRNRKIRKILTRDIWEGMKHRIIGTPSYIINGKVYQGVIPSSVLKEGMK